MQKIPKNNSRIKLIDAKWNSFWTNKIVTIKYDQFYPAAFVKIIDNESNKECTINTQTLTELRWQYVDKTCIKPDWF